MATFNGESYFDQPPMTLGGMAMPLVQKAATMAIHTIVGSSMYTDDCNSDTDFEQLAEDLDGLGCIPSAAEYHGLVCGRLSANRQFQDPLWRSQALEFLGLTAVQDSAVLRRVLALPQWVASELNDAEMTFQLLLPGDEAALEARLVALGEWCSGYLLGLAWGGLDGERWASLSKDLAEGLADLVTISGVDELGDGDEADFMQLYEYVRMVALNVTAEVLLLPAEEAPQPAADPENPVSHLFAGRQTRH